MPALDAVPHVLAFNFVGDVLAKFFDVRESGL